MQINKFQGRLLDFDGYRLQAGLSIVDNVIHDRSVPIHNFNLNFNTVTFRHTNKWWMCVAQKEKDEFKVLTMSI